MILNRYIVALCLLLATATAVNAAEIPLDSIAPSRLAQSQPTPAQPTPSGRVRIDDLWRQVYDRLPNFPLENQYVSLETGQVNPENTLAARLIRYHFYTKGRPPQYRLDWKLTLADYLGANELMFEGVYPGYDNLQSSPMQGDRQAIRNLSRADRDALVQVLVEIFNPQYLQLLQEASDRRNTNRTEPESERNRPPQQPQPGDAQLLLP
jgi:hypothetical protein